MEIITITTQMTKSNPKLSYIIQRYRYKKGYTIENLASIVSVDPNYIKSIELDNYNKIIPNKEIKSILKKLCYALNLKYYKILNLYEKEKFDHINIYYKKDHIKNLINNTSINNQTIRGMVLFLGAFLIVSYISYQIYFFVKIPKVSLSNLNEIEYVENEEYYLKGSTDPNSQLTLNGQRVKINTDGDFDFKLNLNKGVNVFKFVVSKNNRSKVTILKRVYLK